MRQYGRTDLIGSVALRLDLDVGGTYYQVECLPQQTIRKARCATYNMGIMQLGQ